MEDQREKEYEETNIRRKTEMKGHHDNGEEKVILGKKENGLMIRTKIHFFLIKKINFSFINLNDDYKQN